MDEFYSQCRTCLDRLRSDVDCVDLFDDRMLYLVVNQTVPNILILKNDGLPQYICRVCFKELERLTKFKFKCEESNKKLLEIYETLKMEKTGINTIVEAQLEEEFKPEFEVDHNADTYVITTKEKQKDLRCENCSEKFDDKNRLEKHIDIHSCHSYLKCELCRATFSSKKSLRRHYTTSNHMTKTRDFKIEGESSATKIRLYVCDRCPKSYSRSDHLKAHYRSHRGGNEQYQCDICLKFYNLKSVLKDHILNHLGASKALCSFCGKSFSSIANLKQHLLRHTQTKTFQCTSCSKSFISKGELSSHLRTHTGARPFVCNVCGKAFTMSYSLRKHKRSHTGERPYICSYCNKGFKILETLKIHTRIHTGEKPFSCSFCQRAFAQKNDMIKHERIHKDERLYGCALCGKRFIQASTLNTHLKGVHKGQTVILATSQEIPQPIEPTETMVKIDF